MSPETVRMLGMRGRFGVGVDARGHITHVALPTPEPVDYESGGRLSLVACLDGELSMAEDD
ncbi:MAG: hypothetical protein HC923_02880 [Myxococcales bacterium]|nr:hypothetical protein [Myxococcales bacterium]